MTDRAAEKTAFLATAGWGAAQRRHLAGDASARSYERLSRAGQPAVLMDAPPGCGDDVADFLKIGTHLAGLGLSPPAILAMDAAQGFCCWKIWAMISLPPLPPILCWSGRFILRRRMRFWCCNPHRPRRGCRI